MKMFVMVRPEEGRFADENGGGPWGKDVRCDRVRGGGFLEVKFPRR